jgi:hypothetical protein
VTVPAAHFLWEQEHGPVPAGLSLKRTCRSPRCVAPAHRRLCANGFAKLSLADEAALFGRRKAGETAADLAAEYSLHPDTVRRAAHREEARRKKNRRPRKRHPGRL